MIPEFFSSLRFRLLFLVLLAVVPALGLILYTASGQRRHEAWWVQHDALLMVRRASTTHERSIEGARLLLIAVAELPQVRTHDLRACGTLFAHLLKQYPRYANLGAAGPDGNLFCSAAPLARPVNVADRGWFQRAIQARDFAVGESEIGRTTGTVEIRVAYPVLDAAGQVRAVVFAELDLAWVNRFAAEAQLPQGSTLTVRDRKGTILARSHEPEKWVGKTMPEAPVIEAILASQIEGTAEAPGLDGVRRLYAFRRLDGVAGGGDVSMGIPAAAAFAEPDRMLTRNLALLGLVAALALAVAWLSADRFILRPVGALTDATQRVSAGDLSARAGLPHGPGELRQLATAFDHMAGTLEQRETERMRAEQAFERLRRHNELILASAGEGIYGVDLQGNVTFLNPAAERMLGWRAEELIGRYMHPYIHHTRPDGTHYPPDECLMYAALKDGAVRHVDHEVFWRKDGTSFPVEYVSTPIRDEHGEVIGAVSTFKDITERKRAEKAFQQQLTRTSLLNQIARAIAERQDLDSIFQIVLQRLEDHLPVDYGSVFLYDGPADSFTVAAHGPKSHTLAPTLALPLGAVRPVGETGLRACVEGRTVYLPDVTGMDAPMLQGLARAGLRSLLATPLMVENKVFGVLCITRRGADGFSSREGEFAQMLSGHVALAAHQARLYGELQQAYNDLRQTQRAVMQQERLRALGQMASGVAHDIINVLSPVVGFTDLMLTHEPNLSDRVRRYLQQMRTAGTDIAHTVARLREFYRRRAEQETLLPVDLNRVARQAIDLTRPRWRDIPQERGVVVAIETDLREDLPPVLGVESELREALTNVILNAVDAMPTGGTVTVRTFQRTDGSRQPAAARSQEADDASALRSAGRLPPPVVLEVCDTGIGMDEDASAAWSRSSPPRANRGQAWGWRWCMA